MRQRQQEGERSEERAPPTMVKEVDSMQPPVAHPTPLPCTPDGSSSLCRCCLPTGTPGERG